MTRIIYKSVIVMTVILFMGCTEDVVISDQQNDQQNIKTYNKEGTANAKKPKNPGGGNGNGGGGNGVTSYLTGDAADVSTSTSFGIALMGGADAYTNAESEAFQFLVNKSGGGDFVVLRASGSDGYNSFIYNDIGGVNSVETLVIDSQSAADDASVETTVRNAEAIFIAGGNQADYENYWKNTRLEDAINYVINTKNAPIGGSSAGLAILGGLYYAAANGTVYSSEALSDPYNNYMAGLGTGFIDADYMQNVVTDTHYNERDRQGRHFTFMARFVADFGVSASDIKGIGVDEATAVLIDDDGSAEVYGQGDAYFLRGTGGAPENCQSNTDLTWYQGGQAVDAYIVPGTNNGSNTFDLSNWSGSGGSQEYWYANNGNFVRN